MSASGQQTLADAIHSIFQKADGQPMAAIVVVQKLKKEHQIAATKSDVNKILYDDWHYVPVHFPEYNYPLWRPMSRFGKKELKDLLQTFPGNVAKIMLNPTYKPLTIKELSTAIGIPQKDLLTLIGEYRWFFDKVTSLEHITVKWGVRRAIRKIKGITVESSSYYYSYEDNDNYDLDDDGVSTVIDDAAESAAETASVVADTVSDSDVVSSTEEDDDEDDDEDDAENGVKEDAEEDNDEDEKEESDPPKAKHAKKSRSSKKKASVAKPASTKKTTAKTTSSTPASTKKTTVTTKKTTTESAKKKKSKAEAAEVAKVKPKKTTVDKEPPRPARKIARPKD